MKLFIIILMLLTSIFAKAGGPFDVVQLSKYLAKGMTEQDFKQVLSSASRLTRDRSRMLIGEEQAVPILAGDIPGKTFRLDLVSLTDANHHTSTALKLYSSTDDSRLFAEMQNTLSSGKAVPRFEETEEGKQLVSTIVIDSRVNERLVDFFRKAKSNSFGIDVQKTRPNNNVVQFRPRTSK